jgi:DNA-binding NarL/FixJ family response regulator
MTKHYCISSRPDSLERWQKAFPDGRICQRPIELVGQVRAGDLLWMQLPSLTEQRIDEAVQGVTGLFRDCSLVALSKVPDQQEALMALSAGAKGYCHALSNPETLRQVAVVVSHGGLWVGQDLLSRVVTAAEKLMSREHTTVFGNLNQLTSREKAVAREVAKGATNKEIARTLNITERTVKAHLASVFNKLKVRDRLQLVLIMNPSGELMGNAA